MFLSVASIIWYHSHISTLNGSPTVKFLSEVEQPFWKHHCVAGIHGSGKTVIYFRHHESNSICCKFQLPSSRRHFRNRLWIQNPRNIQNHQMAPLSLNAFSGGVCYRIQTAYRFLCGHTIPLSAPENSGRYSKKWRLWKLWREATPFSHANPKIRHFWLWHPKYWR